MKFFPKFERSKSFLGIRVKDIEDFFKLFHQNNLQLFKLKSGEFSITIEKEITEKVQVNKNYNVTQTDNESLSESETDVKNDENFEKLIAPITGTFYTSPAPGSPPYVKEGDNVDEETIVCIIESMKVMNEIKANIKGKVKKVMVKNGDKIKKGDVLFLIEI